MAVNVDYRAMIEEVVKKNIPEDASLILKVTPGAGQEQQLFADEAEIDPD